MSLTQAIILSMLPISEVRLGIPLALASGTDTTVAFIFCTLANMIVIPIVFFFLDFVHDRLLFIPVYRKGFEVVLERTRQRAHSKVEKWGYLGLMLLVAIPLPLTGAYTGTLAAWFFKLRGKKAYTSLLLGVLIAAIIVTIVTMSGLEIFKIFIFS